MSKLQKLYASLPQVECKGECAEYCCPVPLSSEEAATLALIDPEGVEPDNSVGMKWRTSSQANGRCHFLSALGRCTVYDSRPYICRAFGGMPPVRGISMSCKHGCPARPRKFGEAERAAHFKQYLETELETEKEPKR